MQIVCVDLYLLLVSYSTLLVGINKKLCTDPSILVKLAQGFNPYFSKIEKEVTHKVRPRGIKPLYYSKKEDIVYIDDQELVSE